MSDSSWMIYGANGYTAQIIIKVAQERGMKPILAGRNSKVIEALAEEHGLKYSIFKLADSISAIKALENVDIILNCAGPFSETAETIIGACIKTSTHYLDITGEIDVFEQAHSLDERATEASVKN